MADIKKIILPGGNVFKKNVTSGFLFNEDVNSSQTQIGSQTQTGDEDTKNINDTLADSIEDTKKDIANSKTKEEELNKVLSVTKDIFKRNYLTKQLKDRKDEFVKKNALLKNQEASLKNQKESKPEENKEVKDILATAGSSTSLNMEQEMKKIRKKINEAIQQIEKNKALRQPVKKQVEPPVAASEFDLAGEVQKEPAKQSFKVVFDKSTGKPWEVLFTERGFLVNGTTRLSFENVEMAIHKNFNITLDGGKGLVLDQVKLNKIMKYKDRA